jgi:hypothetical protein
MRDRSQRRHRGVRPGAEIGGKQAHGKELEEKWKRNESEAKKNRDALAERLRTRDHNLS